MLVERAYEGLDAESFADGLCIHRGRLPDDLILDARDFQALWNLHPDEFPLLRIHGRLVKTPRWQAVFGSPYHYTGILHAAAPVPAAIRPYLEWTKSVVEPRANGIVVNWYDGALGHYIGRHRDSTKNMIVAAPIVTISFGQSRTMRFRRWRGHTVHDIQVHHGDVTVIPYATNLAWTHEVPRSAKLLGKRISITLRAFHSLTADSK
jgi:alkylated DNA repair dioxygenase AlkB